MEEEVALLVGTWEGPVSSFGPEKDVQNTSTEILRASDK
jgi:hypothetical protein